MNNFSFNQKTPKEIAQNLVDRIQHRRKNSKSHKYNFPKNQE